MPLAYIDDGADHDSSQFFHISRIPTPKGHDTYNITRFKVIHVQLMNPQRKIHKTNWYQCLELDHPSIASDAIDIYRKYHHDFIESPEQDKPIPQIWIDQYSNIGIDLKKIYRVNDNANLYSVSKVENDLNIGSVLKKSNNDTAKA